MAAKNVTLYQIVNGEKIGLNPKTAAGQVVTADNKSVETALAELKSMLTAFLEGPDNDNGVIDRLSEIVAAIRDNRDLIDALNGALTADDIVNDLVTGGADKALAAEQGRALKALVDAIQEKTDKISVDKDGNVSVDGLEMKRYVMYADTLPETLPDDLADGGLIVVG